MCNISLVKTENPIIWEFLFFKENVFDIVLDETKVGNICYEIQDSKIFIHYIKIIDEFKRKKITTNLINEFLKNFDIEGEYTDDSITYWKKLNAEIINKNFILKRH